MKIKILDKYVYEGLGFPVTLLNVPMVEVMGTWAPNIDYNKFQKAMVLLLAHKPVPITGNEIRFIRQYFEMSMEAFGQLFGVSHAAVSKWEGKGDKATSAEISTEKLIRLFILYKLNVNNRKFRNGYKDVFFDVSLEHSTEKKQAIFEPLALDVGKEELIAV